MSTSPQPERIYLAIPRFHQQRSLSCEMACLRMAAHYQTVVRSERELVRLLPKDTAQPRFEDKKLIWADANRVFPGNIYERIVFERAFALLSSGVAVGPPKKVVPVPDPPQRRNPWFWPWHWHWPFRRR